MSLYNTVNVKDLPLLEQVLPGNFLIIENVNGTNKLDFADFVIGPSNTSFYTSLATDVLTISSLTINNTTALKSVSAQLKSEIKTLNDTVTSTVELFSPQNFYYQRSNVTIGVNQTSATMVFTDVSPGFTVNKSEFNLQFNGLTNNLTNNFYPNSGFDLEYNWWFLNTDVFTYTLYISTDSSYPNALKLFSCTLSYFSNT